jgi:hypothetical protein
VPIFSKSGSLKLREPLRPVTGLYRDCFALQVYICIDNIISIVKENRQAPVVSGKPILALLFADVLEIWSFTNNGFSKTISSDCQILCRWNINAISVILNQCYSNEVENLKTNNVGVCMVKVC